MVFKSLKFGTVLSKTVAHHHHHHCHHIIQYSMSLNVIQYQLMSPNPTICHSMSPTTQLPDMMLKSLKLGAVVSKTGGEILGADMIYNYEQVLRQVS